MRTFAAIAVIAAVAAVGWASAADPAKAEFTTTLLVSRVLDIGPRGPGIGDASVRKWRLTDRDGNPVGFGHEACRWTSRTLRLCVAAYGPPGGTIVVEGLIGAGQPLAITGGTGVYQGVSGQVTRKGRTLKFEIAR